MDRSVTVLLPVQDVQSTLAAMVEELLEVTSELTDRFEVVIIDDGSSDATGEIAHELSRHYPQVRAIRHSKPMGHAAAVRTGLEQSQGEVIFVRDAGRAEVRRVHRSGRPGQPNYLRRLGRPSSRVDG